MYGIWTRSDIIYQFNEDGTYVVATGVDELTAWPLEFGDFRFEGTKLTYIFYEGSVLCAGKTGIQEEAMAEDGRIELTLIEDPCASPPARSVFFERYSP